MTSRPADVAELVGPADEHDRDAELVGGPHRAGDDLAGAGRRPSRRPRWAGIGWLTRLGGSVDVDGLAAVVPAAGAAHDVRAAWSLPQRGQRLRAGASSLQAEARRLRLFDFEVFFFGTAIAERYEASGECVGHSARSSSSSAAQPRIARARPRRRPPQARRSRLVGGSPSLDRRPGSGRAPGPGSPRRTAARAAARAAPRRARTRLEVDLVAARAARSRPRSGVRSKISCTSIVGASRAPPRGSAGTPPPTAPGRCPVTRHALRDRLEHEVDLDRLAVRRPRRSSVGEAGQVDRRAAPRGGCRGRRRSSVTGRAERGARPPATPGYCWSWSKKPCGSSGLVGGLGSAPGDERRALELLAPGLHHLHGALEHDLEAGEPLVAEVLALVAQPAGLVLGRLDDVAGPLLGGLHDLGALHHALGPGAGGLEDLVALGAGPWRGTPRAPSAASGPRAAPRAAGRSPRRGARGPRPC